MLAGDFLPGHEVLHVHLLLGLGGRPERLLARVAVLLVPELLHQVGGEAVPQLLAESTFPSARRP